jgi:hypothetical protein
MMVDDAAKIVSTLGGSVGIWRSTDDFYHPRPYCLGVKSNSFSPKAWAAVRGQ